MKPNATSLFGKQSIARKLIPIRKCLILVAAFAACRRLRRDGAG